ncbi:ferrous iron transport protein B [Polluticoccus soli]|uniref:ferrous iron transport protein B n=1 Tax=Polluticoccus soli TaxID=3034150 RepID=UPI0023E0DB33|nr:ferrous iron transport protein B [Flavipsychrobacter sp. JY13-12]
MQRPYTIALVGNPNSGKSSLFNVLTGLNQKVGNFPGVTVDKKTGVSRITDSLSVNIIDLPGTYSLYPKSADEQVTYEVLIDRNNPDRPDLIVVIADASNLKRNLLFCSQIMDLKIPVIIALTMNDIARRKGITIDTTGLERLMGVPVVAINPRKNKGISELKRAMAAVKQSGQVRTPGDFIDVKALTGEWLEEVKEIALVEGNYSALHVACNYLELGHLNAAQRIRIGALLHEVNFHKAKVQAEEVMQRYQKIAGIMNQCVVEESPLKRTIVSERIDKTLLHPLWGNLILLTVLFLLFQSIFWLAEYPMTWVESGFAFVSEWLSGVLPDNLFRDLLINGILAGISGIAVFIPQIMILFGFITILEDSGYMARISFLTDRLMRSVGLNGRSVMPLISGMACAVPAIMATRTIQNRKERLITIMVTPLMSCSARLPVYTILIGLVIPDKSFGIFNLQGLVLMGLYLLGFVMALIVARVMNFIVKVKDKTFFLMELPVYRAPRWKNVGITMIEKAKIFVMDAGKVILAISMLLWVLATFGPPKRMEKVEQQYAVLKQQNPSQAEQIDRGHQTAKLENSFAGIMGHAIEPVIRPLGYDWKIGIALITSFAAREVFVGTMATLYSVGSEDDDATLREKMRNARWPNGEPVYTLAAGLSLLVFYVFAMQCMSTMVIVRRETRSWVYPLIQFAYMFALAYISAFIIYQTLR